MKTFSFFLVILNSVLVSVAQNHPPVAINDTISGTVGDTIYVTSSFLLKNDYDPDGDSLHIGIVGGFHKVNDTTWRRTLTYKDNSIVYGNYIVRDQYLNSVPAGVITVFVNGGFRADSLDANNINAMINPSGSHFWNFETAHFEVPKGSGKNSIFTHNVWVSGLRDDSQLCAAAEQYRQNGADFIVGPVTTSSDSNYYIKWNRDYKIDKTQIRYHINNWNQPGYVPIDVIKNWPAHGDTTLGQSENIAPYYDNNSNGIYEPMSGDYPMIRGDEAVFFVFNDDVIHAETHGERLKIEIHGMAYEYNRPDDSTLNNTLFMHYDIINRSADNYHDTYIGLFTDFDLGFPQDDYIATDVTNGLLYCYNGTSVDGSGQPWAYGDHPPAIGLKLIGGPLLEPDGIDNPGGNCDVGINGLNFGDGTADNERMGLNVTMNNGWGYMNSYGELEFSPYQAMQGFINGTTIHMMYGSADNLGGVGPACNYVYPGNSDTLCNYGTNGIIPNGGFNQNGYYWTEATTGNVPDDRRGLASVGPFNFTAGQSVPIDYCFTWARDYNGDNISSAELLRERIAALAPSWNNLITSPVTYFGVPDNSAKASISVYPNPVHNQATVSVEGTFHQPYLLYSVNGTLISKGEFNPGKNLLDLSSLKPGVYILQSGSRNVRIVKM